MNNNDETITITLVDSEGSEIVFEHELTFTYEDERYMALSPAGLSDDEEADVVFMRIVKVDGEDGLEPVENEVLLDELFEAFCELIDEASEASAADAQGE